MDAKKLNLEDLLKKIKDGTIQLPDFQRDWVWSDEQIKSLIESVIRGFPINSILLLECGANNLHFSCRPIEGTDKTDVLPQNLILDGQQRLTSLFGALFSDKPFKISKGKKEFFYYVNMAKAVESIKNSSDMEDMIISVPSSRKLKAKGVNWDLSTPEKEYAAGMFPLNKIFDRSLLDWSFNYKAYYANDIDKQILITEFNNLAWKINRYEVVAIELEKDTPPAAICKIFDNVNRRGEKLGVFDLLTAIFAAHVDENSKPIELRKDWDAVHANFEDNGLEVLEEVDRSDFVTALTLLVSYEKFRADKKNLVSCKGEDILKLSYADYVHYKADVIDGFIEAGKFLEGEGLTTKKYLPYKSQLVPMAALFAELKLSGKDNAASRNKIRQWYWCAVFSESYKDGSGSRFAKDMAQVMKWIDKREEPKIIRDTQIGAVRLMSVNSTRSAAYKGMIAIILKNGARDFLAGRNIGTSANYAENIEIHHIFPKKYCEARGLSKAQYDNIANKTLILKKTNQTIGGDPPSIYLKKIERKTGLSSAEVDEILERHFINAALCRADDFDAFIAARAEKIFDVIEELTGRKVVGRPL